MTTTAIVRRAAAGEGKDQVVTVAIDRLAPGGDAVGRQQGGAADGRVTFVALAAPGERVRARLFKTSKRVAWGELESIVEDAPLSPVRVSPACRLFGDCGGCQWQHVALAAQRHAKSAIVGRALGIEPPIVCATGPDLGYRERCRFVVGLSGALGFRRRRRHDVVDVERCPLLAPALEAAMPAVRAWAKALPSGSEIQVLVGRGEKVGVSHLGKNFVVRGDRVLPACGDVDGWLDVSEDDGAPLAIFPGAFSQVGRRANAALVATVRAFLGPRPGRVLELFAGAGNFTRTLVDVADEVIAADGSAAAVALGKRNVPAADWRHQSNVLDPNVDTVVVDPPRAGLDPHAFHLVTRARRRVVYVSCDPQTLGRDVRRLAEHGFERQQIKVFDLMPHSHHVETVVALKRT